MTLTGVQPNKPTRNHAVAWLAGMWAGGTAAGLWWGWAGAWLAAAAVSLGGALGMWWRGRKRGVWTWGLVAGLALAAGWSSLRMRYVPANHVSRYLSQQGAPVRITGTVLDEPQPGGPQGIFGPSSRHGPATRVVVALRTIEVAGTARPVSGRVLTRIGEVGGVLTAGMVIEAEGWLRALPQAENPGEFDSAQWWARQGVEGGLAVERSDNVRIVEHNPPSWFDRVRQALGRAAAQSLHAGLSGRQDQATVLLDAVLLGLRGPQTNDLYAPFQRTGLIHLLSISGAHLAVLLGLAWLVARLALPHPSAAALVVLVVLALYLLVVPAEVPIVRSGIMAGAFCLAYASGRRVTSLQALGAATILVLVLWPAEVASPGFQLSFGIVAGFVLFVGRVERWLLGDTDLLEGLPSTQPLAARTAAGWLAVNVVAFLIALPIVAYHFRLVSLGSVPVSILGAPLVTAVLVLGYLKIVAGLVLPSAGLALAGPLHATAAALVGAVDWSARVPGVALQLVGPRSAAWAMGGLALVAALFCGVFRGRRAALLAATALWVVWALAADLERVVGPRVSEPSVTVNMLSVGDGSCYVLRLRDPQRGQGAFVFDVGSQERLDVGQRVAAPALREMGVRRLEAVFISHADLDHVCGLPDLLNAVAVGRVVVTPQVLREAEEEPAGTAGLLVEAVRKQGVALEAIERGWRERWGAIELEALWPASGLEKLASNDASLVLSVRVGEKRLLLWGDLQQAGMTRLMALEDEVRGEVCDLPHHGSFVAASPLWLKAVGPRVVLQSCGPKRLWDDPWPAVLAQVGAGRWVTARCGAVEARLTAQGVCVRGFGQ